MSKEFTLLVVGEDLEDTETILSAMEMEPYRVVTSNHLADAERHLASNIDLVILHTAQFQGLELLRNLKAKQPQVLFLAIANGNDVVSAVEAMKLGAADCLVKPIDAEELRMLVAKLLDGRGTSGEPHGTFREFGGPPVSIDIPPGTSLEDLERAAVEQALAQHRGNRTHAAKTLGISVRTLQRKLKAWGLPIATGAQHASKSANQHLVFSPLHAHSTYGGAHAH